MTTTPAKDTAVTAAALALATFDWRRDRRSRQAHGTCTEDVANSPVHARQT